MDEIDLKLLTMLQANARTTNAELARQVGLAPSSTLERVRRLEERGIIRGYRAVVDPRAMGYRVQAVVMVNLRGHQAEPIDTFEEHVGVVPEVKLCLNVTGRYDYLLLVVARDIDHLRRLVTRDLAAIPGVQKQETFLVLAIAKEEHALAVPDEDEGRETRRAGRGRAAGSKPSERGI